MLSQCVFSLAIISLSLTCLSSHRPKRATSGKLDSMVGSGRKMVVAVVVMDESGIRWRLESGDVCGGDW
ncbi:hypothetical protein A2U01_0076200 [Trifolium medium]|uniref:Secreted protein n=1 Tax=Trifolium medium TaxID=97028 RepID=A0A392T481_9FABA|nr:hypothetical protein [Trifolium medium]